MSPICNKTRSLNLLWPKLGSFWILVDSVECFASAPTLFQRSSGRRIKPGMILSSKECLGWGRGISKGCDSVTTLARLA